MTTNPDPNPHDSQLTAHSSQPTAHGSHPTPHTSPLIPHSSHAWKLHDNVNTDEIIPGRYNMTTDRDYLAQHCLCEVRPDFPGGVKEGDVIVGGRNFGCGSSREHAPVAIQACGVAAVIAPSYARIFYRNAVNVGLPLLTCKDANRIQEGDEVEVDIASGTITNRTRGEQYTAEPLPAFIARIAEEGGILEFIRNHGWEGVAS